MPSILNNDLVLLALTAVFVLLIYLILSAFSSSDTPIQKRIDSMVVETGAARVKPGPAEQQLSARRKSVAETLKELEAKKTKVTLRLRLERAGLDVEPRDYYIASAGLGVACAVLVGLLFSMKSPFILLATAFVGSVGLPRLILAQLIKRRQAKFLTNFANSIDLIVRGVKSGLPLNECLAIIAREAPSPICEEFSEVVDQQRLGVPLSECFERLINRMPLAEVKFFSIVIAIQMQSGGNVAEALGNLSNVLRDRRRLADKVAGLSAEAKASAVVLGAMPFIVTLMVYLSAPKYITVLWTTNPGILLLVAAGIWMSIGMVMMRAIINFKY